MGERPLVQLHDSARPAPSMASGACETTHRRLRAGDQFALAHRAGYIPAEVGADDAAGFEQLALCTRALRLSFRADVGAEIGRAAKASLGEPVMATESATLVGASEGYRLWSATYDRDPNPILALERGVIAERLGPLSGRCLIDIGAGTGYWPAYAQAHGARAYAVDICEAMLRQATAKPGLRGCLVLADM